MSGLVEGCETAGCALVGGEMAEHPGTMDPDALDVAGFAVGVVERDRLITGDAVAPGDALVGRAAPTEESRTGCLLSVRVPCASAGTDRSARLAAPATPALR